MLCVEGFLKNYCTAEDPIKKKFLKSAFEPLNQNKNEKESLLIIVPKINLPLHVGKSFPPG